MQANPPKILHLHQPQDEDVRLHVLSTAMQKLRVPKASQKLMHFYASCLNGCKAPLSVVQSATGISANHISERRKTLVKYGLLAYSSRLITIDWNILRAFASLDPSLMGQKEHWHILPDRQRGAYQILHLQPHNEDERQYRTFYAATRQAILDGIHFPDLSPEQEQLFVDPPPLVRDSQHLPRLELVGGVEESPMLPQFKAPSVPLPF